MYTSGTTGFPKGVLHSHNVIRNVVDRAFRMAITPADTILNYLPLFHLFGFSEGLLMSMVTGAREVLTETFDPAESLRLLENLSAATIVHGFDTHFKDLLEAQQRRPRDVSSVRTCIMAAGMASSSGRLPAPRAGPSGPLVSGYGMTEILVGAAIGAPDSHRGAVRRGLRLPGAGLRDHGDRSLRPAASGPPAKRRRDPGCVSGDAHAGLHRQARGDRAGHRPGTAGCTPGTWA